MHALRRRATEYGKRKATLRRSRRVPEPTVDTIAEAEEENVNDEEEESPYQHVPVVRTNTYKDPEDLEERDC